jgi:hypothetical protein
MFTPQNFGYNIMSNPYSPIPKSLNKNYFNYNPSIQWPCSPYRALASSRFRNSSFFMVWGC